MRMCVIISTIVIFFLASSAVYAQTSQSTVDVETNVTGSGTTSTHVETNVNGNDHVYNSDKPGSVHIENNGTTYSVQTSEESNNSVASPSATPKPTGTASQSIKNRPQFSLQAFFQQLLQKIKNFLTL